MSNPNPSKIKLMELLHGIAHENCFGSIEKIADYLIENNVVVQDDIPGLPLNSDETQSDSALKELALRLWGAAEDTRKRYVDVVNNKTYDSENAMWACVGAANASAEIQQKIIDTYLETEGE